MATGIYEPKGKAREYSPLALNIYKGCDHKCRYCYVNDMPPGVRSDVVQPIPGVCEKVTRYIATHDVSDQVLLSFISDPYPPMERDSRRTRTVLELFARNKVPTAILTKAGERCLVDLELFRCMGSLVKVGATLTFCDPEKSLLWEPGAALPDRRINMLDQLHRTGVRTWASFEPVIEPEETLLIMQCALPFLNEVKIGKWNHDPRAAAIDWTAFIVEAVEKCRAAGVDTYVKNDLRPFAPPHFLKPGECNADLWALKRLPRESPHAR